MRAFNGVMSGQAEQRIRAQQLNAALNSRVVGMQNMATSTYMGGPAHDPRTDTKVHESGYLDELPEHVEANRAFVARQLVQQAQLDYQNAVKRGDTAAQDATRARLEAVTARTDAATQRQRAEAAEAKLRALQPDIRKRVLGPQVRDVQYEPTKLWLATSWALILAGIVVCAL